MSDYSLADYFREADHFEYPDWFYGVKLRYPPWPHQVLDLKFILKHERFGLFNDAGVGKTLPMQAVAILYCCGYKNKGVVCMPPALIGQFMESFFHPEESYFLGLEKFVNIKAFSGTKKKKDVMWATWNAVEFPDIIVMSYAAFGNMHPIKAIKSKPVKNKNERTDRIKTSIKFFSSQPFSTTKFRKKNLAMPDTSFTLARGYRRVTEAVKPLRNHPLKQLGFNVLLFDEAQALKTVSSGIHKKLFKYIGNTEGDFLVGLFTGSPIGNTLMDAHGMVHILTPDTYPTVRSFERAHCIYSKDSDHKLLIGFKDQEKLHDNLYAVARRVTKQQVLSSLPPMVPEAVTVELSGTHMRWYRKLLTERVLDLPSGYIDATQSQKLRQVALQMITNPQLYIPVKVENELLNVFDAKLNSFNPQENKVIVFSYFTSTVEFLKQQYADLNPAVINGSSGNKDKAVRKFLDDPTCRIIIINWLSGGAGLNLQIANYMLFYEQPTVPQHAIQAIARSHRGGQDKAVNVVFFKVKGTLMAKSLKQLLDKDRQVNEVVRDKHEMLHELLGTK